MRFITKIEAVKYYWREWYTRTTYDDGTTLHSEPWLSQMAADYLAKALRLRAKQKGLWKGD